MMMETETIDRLFLELSQVTQATTAKELAMRAALADMLGGWRYIRQSHGDLYGVGWGRAQEKAEKALGLQPGQEMPAAWFGA
jgi:hypothetical protein